MAPPKKKKPSVPAAVPTKASFFQPKRAYGESVEDAVAKKKETDGCNTPTLPPPPRSRARQQRLLYEQGTDLPYARVEGDVAYCLETGQELFRFRSGGDEEDQYVPSVFGNQGFDFTPPNGNRHPDDPSVDVRGLVDAGLLSDEDVASRRGFTADELRDLMLRLEAYRSDREAMCVLDARASF